VYLRRQVNTKLEQGTGTKRVTVNEAAQEARFSRLPRLSIFGATVLERVTGYETWRVESP
jgi:hypothetical protein